MMARNSVQWRSRSACCRWSSLLLVLVIGAEGRHLLTLNSPSKPSSLQSWVDTVNHDLAPESLEKTTTTTTTSSSSADLSGSTSSNGKGMWSSLSSTLKSHPLPFAGRHAPQEPAAPADPPVGLDISIKLINVSYLAVLTRESDLATLVSSLPGPTLARLLNMGFTQLETSSAMKYILEDAGYDSVDTFLPGIPAFKKDVMAAITSGRSRPGISFTIRDVHNAADVASAEHHYAPDPDSIRAPGSIIAPSVVVELRAVCDRSSAALMPSAAAAAAGTAAGAAGSPDRATEASFGNSVVNSRGASASTSTSSSGSGGSNQGSSSSDSSRALLNSHNEDDEELIDPTCSTEELSELLALDRFCWGSTLPHQHQVALHAKWGVSGCTLAFHKADLSPPGPKPIVITRTRHHPFPTSN